MHAQWVPGLPGRTERAGFVHSLGARSSQCLLYVGSLKALSFQGTRQFLSETIDKVKGVPAMVRTRWFLRSLPSHTFLWFYELPKFQTLWTRLAKMWILTCPSAAASESILPVLSSVWESAPSSLWFLDQKNVSINMYKLFLQTAASFGGLLQIAFQVFRVWIWVHFLSYLPRHVCTFRWVVSLVTSGRNYSWSLPTIRMLFSTIHGL